MFFIITEFRMKRQIGIVLFAQATAISRSLCSLLPQGNKGILKKDCTEMHALRGARPVVIRRVSDLVSFSCQEVNEHWGYNQENYGQTARAIGIPSIQNIFFKRGEKNGIVNHADVPGG